MLVKRVDVNNVSHLQKGSQQTARNMHRNDIALLGPWFKVEKVRIATAPFPWKKWKEAVGKLFIINGKVVK
jgi:hypothetical protein